MDGALGKINENHPRNTQTCFSHFRKDKFWNDHMRYHRAYISNPHQRQQQHKVQRSRRQGPAPHNPQIP